MPLHKTQPPTRKPCRATNTQLASGAASPFSVSTDKSNYAGRMAQELASQSSWADRYVPATPTTTATPAESVADTQSQIDTSEPPPSYEDARLERDRLASSQPIQENVRQEPSSLGGPSTLVFASTPPRDVEIGPRTPLLHQNMEVVKVKKRKQKRFIVVFIILAIWLMGIQAIKGFGIGFWRADGTPIPPIPSRSYTRHETSQSITGTFTFYDSLDLSTMSGSINIEIDPQASDSTGVIRLSTRSGSVRVKFSDEYMKAVAATGMLDRAYDIEIRTASGSHNLELPQGNGGTTSLTSESGSISAKLHMTRAGKGTNATTLITKSSSGSQQIKIKSTSSEPINSLAAKHYSSGSATIRVGLPPTWEGMVHASTGGSGSVDIKGEGLHYQRNGNKETYAWRILGDGSKQPSIEGQVVEARVEGSGSIKVDCSSS